MPNILSQGGVYFDPEDPKEIAAVLQQLIVSPDARAKYSAAASERVRPYTWERCAEETFSFLKGIA
jgi:glycosyltransferase involved in cell wall biosynthesis